jgi:hypothetical protein
MHYDEVFKVSGISPTWIGFVFFSIRNVSPILVWQLGFLDDFAKGDGHATIQNEGLDFAIQWGGEKVKKLGGKCSA